MITTPRPDLDGQHPALVHAPLAAAAHGALENAETLAHRTAERTRQEAHRLLEAGSHHIRERPLQSVLMAAAAGAVLLLVAEWVVRAVRGPR